LYPMPLFSMSLANPSWLLTIKG